MYNMEKEETLFKLEAFKASPRSSESHDFNTDNSAKTWSIDILSRRRTIRNGKVIETTTPSCSVSIPSVNWCTLKSNTVINNSQNLIRLEFNVERNTSSTQRVAYIGITQDGSGNGIILYLHQEAGVTYTSVIEIPQFYIISLANKAGASTTFEFTSYLLGSDGSKVAEKPSVSSLSSWLEVTSVEKGSSEHSYVVTFTANSSHSSNLSRVGEAVIHCGTASKNINVSQLPQLEPIVKQFTLTGLPLNKSCYLFASGSRPQSGGSGSTSGYLMIHGLDGQVTMNIPVKVNLSSYGDTTEADTGDKVTVWTSSGSLFSQIGSFTVPSAGGTVSI